MQNEVEEFGIQAIAYEELQSEFQEVLMSLSSDQTLDRFRVEYEKIHRALKHSHQQQKKLLGKCRQLSKDIIAGAAKLQSALKFSNDDSHTISYLKAQVSKTYKYLQLSRQHEQLSKQKIQKLKAEMKRLHTMMQQNQSINEGRVASVSQYTIANEELQKEKQILQVSLESNKAQLLQIQQKITENQNLKLSLKQQYEELLKKKSEQQLKVKSEEQNKKLKKDQLEVIKVQFDNARAEQSNNKNLRKDLNFRFKELDSKLYEVELAIEKQKKTLKKLQKQEAIQNKKLNEIEEINTSMSQLTKKKQRQLEALKQEVQKQQMRQANLRKTSQGIQQQIMSLKIQKQEIEKLKESINLGLMQLQTEINEEKKSSSKDKSFIEKLKRDRDMYKKQLQRSETNNKKIFQEIINKEKTLKQKENQLFGQKKEIEKLNKQITALEKERDANSFQATSAQAKYFYARDQVKLRDNFIAQFQKQNIETESKLKKQQSLYEAVRADRNLVSKKLAQIQQQKSQYSNRYRRVTHQITQLKQEIDTKEADLVKEHNQHKKKDKKIEDEEKKIGKYEKDITQKDDKIKNYKIEIEKLRAIIKQTTYQQQKLQQEYELVVSERDILGTQLIKRSAQADLLYEKIKINQSALAKGEVQYNQKIIDIETQKEEIAALMNEIKNYRNQNSAISDLKAQIHNLTRQLTESKLKVKALSQEIQNPMNVHRWRKLQATDSATYELMTKIQSIQKRLISKTQEVKQKQRQLEKREQQLKSLQQVLKRQPSIEQQKMIPVYEQNLQQKQRQITAMKEQINNYEQTMQEYSIQLERLQKELQNYKKKFFIQKKRELQQKQEKKTQQDYIKVILPDKRFTGGGFNLAI